MGTYTDADGNPIKSGTRLTPHLVQDESGERSYQREAAEHGMPQSLEMIGDAIPSASQDEIRIVRAGDQYPRGHDMTLVQAAIGDDPHDLGVEVGMVVHGQDFPQLKVGAWAETTFPHSDLWSIAIHTFRECVELIFALPDERGTDPAAMAHTLIREVWRVVDKERRKGKRLDTSPIQDEAADIQLLIWHFAHKAGFSLTEESFAKFRRIQNEAWGAPDDQGVSERQH